MIRVSILFFLLNSFEILAGPPSGEIDIKHYVFNIELNDTTDTILGEAQITVLFKKTTNNFTLDLGSQKQSGKGMRVLEVSSAGSQPTFTHANDLLRIVLEKTANAGDELVFRIRYSGIPLDGLIIGKNKYGDRTFFGDNWPNRAHHWLPVNDHPSDKATVEFKVIAPIRYEVIANGLRKEESILNKKQKFTHWSESVAIPTKVMVIGAAQFAIQFAEPVGEIQVEHWVYPQNREQGFHDFSATQKILKYFIERIGPYPYEKLANVQSKTLFGGMENASNIFYSENLVNGKADHDELIAHEIAHQWFGNSAAETDWHHVWLSEGFATYFSNLYTEFSLGDKARAVAMAADRKAVIDFYKKQPLPIVFESIPVDMLELLNTNSYQKGSWVLHMLRKEIGDDIFWSGVRQYYKEYGGGNARTSDLQRIMETVSGANLTSFFKQWVYTAGYPVLKKSWKFDQKKGLVEVTVEQVQPGNVYEFPLEIGWAGPGFVGTGVEKVRVTSKSAKFLIKTGFKPTSILLDPAVNLLFDEPLKN